MRGTGPVVLDGQLVYGFFDGGAGALRLRVSVDEFDRLGLCEGRRVRAELPGREPGFLLLTGAERVPPFVWLDLAQLGPAVRAG